MSIYYVYSYLRDDGTPYYIGKGSGNRAYTKGKGEVGKPTDTSRIVLLAEGLTEEEAFNVEKRLIKLYGRIDNNTGILRNKTDGGDNPPKFISHSEQGKQNISAGRRGMKFTEEHRKNLSAARRNISDETRAKMKAAKLGKSRTPHSEETRRKISAAVKRTKNEMA